jgi:atypical dual specificity phosphatase
MSDLESHILALNFSWLEEGLVAGCRGPRTDDDLAFLRSLGVQALVRLAAEEETGLVSADVERSAIRDCYEPVPDWTAPSQRQIDRVVGFIKAVVANAEAVAVSCGAGCGRTGTVLGCYLVSQGLGPEAAIEKLTTTRPCSREILRVPGQKEAVVEFYRRMQEIK